MNIEQLSKNIIEIHRQLQKKASAAVNISLTIRNWFIGYYIVEYEQKGEDRAKYGKKLIRTLSEKLQQKKLKGVSFTNLNVYRKFYVIYPHLGEVIPEYLNNTIVRTLPEQFQSTVLQENTSAKYLIPPEKSITKLYFLI